MSTAAEKANLARIRDNQRRSRARRKEYLQELEARLRQCELQGIEASSEIQMAARRVADENRKLRSLLAQHGVGDDGIDAYLQSSPTNDTMMGQYGSSNSNAVHLLEQLLQTRKMYCADGNAPMNSGMAGGTGSRDSSASISTSLWDPVQNSQNVNGRRRSGTLRPTGKAASSAHQFMTPSTTASRTSSVVSLGQDSNRGVHHHQRLAPAAALPPNLSPASNPSRHTSQSFDFDLQLSLSNPSSYNNSSNHLTAAHQHLQPHTQPQRSSLYIPTASTSSNVNSCVYATDMITTMAGGDPSLISAELGCMPDMEDCEVDNHLVFNVMDRYTDSVGL